MVKKKTSSKKIVKIPTIPKPGAKLRKKPEYKHFRLHKSIKYNGPPLPSWWVLLKKSSALMVVTKRQLAVYFIVYGALTLLLVRGFSSPFNMDSINQTFDGLVEEEIAGFASGFTAFNLLINSTSEGVSEISQTYQSILVVICSLAIIWLYRQHQAGNKVSMKMAFYRGLYPLIPFLLVVGAITIQLLPALVGNFLFSSVMQSGLAVNMLEKSAWIALLITTMTLSFYLLSGSIIALYIVTLPEMTPMRALGEAKKLVMHRRISVMRKMLALVLIILFLVVLIILPLIFFIPVLAEWLFFAMTIMFVPLVHGYMFSLYRELL